MQPSWNCWWSFSISRFERHVPIARRNPSLSAGREARDLDRDPHDLLLVEDHAHRVPEDRLEARVEVRHRLEALLPAQVRVDGVALDRAGPDDRDLDDEVVEGLRARLRQRLHLGPALDLEDPDRVGRLEHLEDLGDLLGDRVEDDAGPAVVLDQLDGLVDRGEHPEPEQVELDELELLDVALVELDDDPVLHRRPLDRRDVDERCRGDEHPAEWMHRCRGKPSIRAQSSSQRSQSDMPTVLPPRGCGTGSGSTRATDECGSARRTRSVRCRHGCSSDPGDRSRSKFEIGRSGAAAAPASRSRDRIRRP